MEKLLALLNLFRQGNAVANPSSFDNRAMLTAALVAVLAAAERFAAAFGFPLGITDSDNTAIAAGVAAVYFCVCTVIRSDKAGLPPVGGDGNAGGDQPRRDGEPAEKLYP